MELFALEHKRLWRTTRVRICVLLCLVYCVLYGGVLSFQWYIYGSMNDATSAYSNNFDGYAMIQASKARAAKYGGVWTDETFRQMVQEYNDLGHPGLQNTDWGEVQSYLDDLYPELTDPENFLPMIYYVDTDELTGFYERRQDYLEYNFEVYRQNGVLTTDDVEMLREMDSHVQAPPWKYDWMLGWKNFLGTTLPANGSSMAPYLAIVLAFLFSGEWRSNTAPLLHTTKNGWKRLARVKILSGLAFAAELYLLVEGGLIAAQLVYLGTDGWDMPIQFVKLVAVAPWNMLQAELYELLFTFLGVIGYAGVVMLFSSLVKSNVLALTFSLALTYVPSRMGYYLPLWAQNASQFLPLVGSPTDIFRLNVFHIFGKGVWLPYMTITIPVLIGAVCIPFAVMNWSRRQRA